MLTAAALKSAREAEGGSTGGLLLRSCSLAELADWAWALARFDLKTVRGGWVGGWREGGREGGREGDLHWLGGDREGCFSPGDCYHQGTAKQCASNCSLCLVTPMPLPCPDCPTTVSIKTQPTLTPPTHAVPEPCHKTHFGGGGSTPASQPRAQPNRLRHPSRCPCPHRPSRPPQRILSGAAAYRLCTGGQGPHAAAGISL